MCRTHGSDLARTSRIEADDIRPSDAEREEIVSQMRAHAGDGRLDVEELERRVARAYSTTTRRHLVELVRDLPRPSRESRRHAHAHGLGHDAFEGHVRTYLAVMALLVVIWALTGMGYFWPIWPMLGWGIGVLPHSGALRGPRRRRLTA